MTLIHVQLHSIIIRCFIISTDAKQSPNKCGLYDRINAHIDKYYIYIHTVFNTATFFIQWMNWVHHFVLQRLPSKWSFIAFQCSQFRRLYYTPNKILIFHMLVWCGPVFRIYGVLQAFNTLNSEKQWKMYTSLDKLQHWFLLKKNIEARGRLHIYIYRNVSAKNTLANQTAKVALNYEWCNRHCITFSFNVIIVQMYKSPIAGHCIALI